MKLGVALAGGAFKGICHLGALEVLEKNGIKIDMVSGCSLGAGGGRRAVRRGRTRRKAKRGA